MNRSMMAVLFCSVLLYSGVGTGLAENDVQSQAGYSQPQSQLNSQAKRHSTIVITGSQAERKTVDTKKWKNHCENFDRILCK